MVGLARHLRENRSILMLKAYFDDSGSHDQADFYVVAGYVASVEQWIRFESEWRSVLAASPSLEYFKGWEAHRRAKQFDGLTSAESANKVRQLADVIVRNVAYEVSVAVPRPEYERFVSSLITTRQERKYRVPYVFCYEHIVIMLGAVLPLLMAVGKDTKLDVVLDQQNGVAGITTDLHGMFRQSSVFRAFGTLSFADDKDVLPLQASDFIAWGLNRFLTNGEVKPGWEKVLAMPSLRLLANERHLQHHAYLVNVQAVEDVQLALQSEGDELRRREAEGRADPTDADRSRDPGAQS